MEKECEQKQFDPDLSPENPHNREAARQQHLRFDQRRGFYRDADGSLVRDRFGQPL
jgi:hypothetical protein